MLVHRLIGLSSVVLAVGACSAASNDNQAGRPPGAGGLGAGGAGSGTVAAVGSGAGTGIGTGSTGTGMGPQESNAGGTPIFGGIMEMDPNNANCAGIVNKGEQITVDLFIMFDQSLSMSCMIPSGGDRWDAVKNALTQFLMLPNAAGINVGIQYFGLGGFTPLAASCTASDYQNADVEIGPLPMNAQPISDSLNKHMPSTNTPTPAALQGAIDHATSYKMAHPGHTVVVVLITDGQPNACGGIPEVTQTAATGFMNMIPTYVIGVTSPNTTCMYDQNPPNQADLDTVAMAGGTMSALLVDTTGDTAMQFVATMNKIRATSQVPCQYALPKPMSGQMLDPTKVNVEYTPPGQTMATTVLGVTANTCDPNTGGWYYDNPVAPTKINLCPSTCSAATTMIGGQINIAVGCATKKPA